MYINQCHEHTNQEKHKIKQESQSRPLMSCCRLNALPVPRVLAKAKFEATHFPGGIRIWWLAAPWAASFCIGKSFRNMSIVAEVWNKRQINQQHLVVKRRYEEGTRKTQKKNQTNAGTRLWCTYNTTQKNRPLSYNTHNRILKSSRSPWTHVQTLNPQP